MELKFTATLEDLEKAILETSVKENKQSCYCLVAQTLKRELNLDYVGVGVTTCRLSDDFNPEKVYNLDNEAQFLVENFDRKEFDNLRKYYLPREFTISNSFVDWTNF